eukprot:scaffold3363_cov122-Isochrysis_galbana.AAC.5
MVVRRAAGLESADKGAEHRHEQLAAHFGVALLKTQNRWARLTLPSLRQLQQREPRLLHVPDKAAEQRRLGGMHQQLPAARRGVKAHEKTQLQPAVPGEVLHRHRELRLGGQQPVAWYDHG